MKARWFAGALAVAVVATACGSSSKSGSGSTPTTASGGSGSSAPAVTDTSLGTGVTADSIKVGIAMVDYDSIKQFIDFNHGDQQKAYQAFIDDINKNGGINGRKLVPTYQTYTPIGSTGPSNVCTKFTEDTKVFAVIGVFLDPTGAAQLCVSKNHKTVLITHELSQDTIGKAPAGLMLTPDITAERRIDVLMSLLKSQGTLQGKKVAILAETGTKPRVKSAIKPALDSLGVQQGTTAVIATGTNPDTTAAQQQLGSFIERWKSEGVNAIVISGLDIVAKNFVEQIKQQMPDVLLMTDGESSANQAGQDETKAGKKPNPYEGMLTANGNTDDETFASPSVQKCVSVYQAATGQTVLAPKDVTAGADGHRAEVYQGVEDACGELTFFKVIAAKVGQYLNDTNWTNTVNSFGSMNGMLVGSQYASLKAGKYDADNGFRLVSFDSTIPPSGNWKSVTQIEDTAAG